MVNQENSEFQERMPAASTTHNIQTSARANMRHITPTMQRGALSSPSYQAKLPSIGQRPRAQRTGVKINRSSHGSNHKDWHVQATAPQLERKPPPRRQGTNPFSDLPPHRRQSREFPPEACNMDCPRGTFHTYHIVCMDNTKLSPPTSGRPTLSSTRAFCLRKDG